MSEGIIKQQQTFLEVYHVPSGLSVPSGPTGMGKVATVLIPALLMWKV